MRKSLLERLTNKTEIGDILHDLHIIIERHNNFKEPYQHRVQVLVHEALAAWNMGDRERGWYADQAYRMLKAMGDALTANAVDISYRDGYAEACELLGLLLHLASRGQ